MKKIGLLFILLILFPACTKKVEYKEVEEVQKEVENIPNEPKPNNIVTVGLYKNYNGKRELITTYTDNWEYHKDISSFEVYYTNELELANKKQIALFQDYLDKYPSSSNYKIGYIIEFNTTMENINKTILNPKDTESIFSYIEVYLYDDYHQNGGWYSHVTEEEFNENTILTSIKLTAGVNINDVISPITLTSFVYDNENNSLGEYTITVSKEN